MKFLSMCFVIMLWGIMPSVCNAGAAALALRKCREEAHMAPPEVEVIYNYGNLVFDYNISSEQLSEKVQAMYSNKITHRITGLTELSPYIVVESSIVQSGTTRYLCYYPEKVKVKVGYEPVVYIRQDLQKGTCRYNLTIRHEQTHLDIGDLAMTNFLQEIKRSLPRIIKEVGVIVKPYSDKVSALDNSNELNNLYRKQLSHMFDRFVKNMVAQQMRIDTMESYNAAGSLCPSD